MKFNRIALMGAGSLGTILGAYLTRGGVNVDLIDVYQAHVDALNEQGATVMGTVELNVKVHAMTPDQMTGKYDLFLYLAKQTYNETAISQMAAHLAPDGYICVFQNGVPEDAVADVIGKEHTLGATVGWGATFQKPGVSEATTLPANWYFDIGTMDGQVTEELKELQKILELMCPAHIVTNWMGARWLKLLANVAMSGMSAALGCTFGDILDNDHARLCAQHLARECVRVTVGQGYTPAIVELNGTHTTVDKVMEFSAPEDMARMDAVFHITWDAHRASVASMLQDLRKGRKTEVEAINGVLCRGGRKCGVPTPVSDRVVEIIHEIEDGKRTACMENLKEFDLFEGIEIKKTK